jgi:hypothetical protein
MPNLIDQIRGHQMWREQDRDLYNRLPVYFAKTSADHQKYFGIWNKLLKPMPWSANQGRLLRGIRKERSPVLRAEALPNVISALPTKDVIETREVTEEAQLYRKDFDSQLFHFEPYFEDFLTNGIDFTLEDINEKIMVYHDLFYRTAIFHGAPSVYICGKPTELTSSPHWDSPAIARSKTQGHLQQYIADATHTLTLEHMSHLATVMQVDVGAAFYKGSQLADGTDGAGIAGKYAMVLGSEVWDYWQTSSYLLNNKNHNLDVVTGPFRGSLFGKWTTMQERFELRIAADGTIPIPETIEETVSAYNYGETVVNPAWRDAPYAVAFAVGAEAYKSMRVGAPPKLFTGDMSLEKFNGMDWNGKVHMTRNVLVPTVDQDGAVVNDTNKRGEYLMLISDLIMGILPIKRRHIIPVIYRRERVDRGT